MIYVTLLANKLKTIQDFRIYLRNDVTLITVVVSNNIFKKIYPTTNQK